MINDTNGCSKFICGELENVEKLQKLFHLQKSLTDCVPKDQCKPLQKYTLPLDVGYKVLMDTSGCCPREKLVCDKSLCPSKLTECKESFYQVDKTKTADDKICCDEYKCCKYKT